MKAWVKNVMRKQERHRRQQSELDNLDLHLTDPLEWSNLITSRIGFACGQASKQGQKLSNEDSHILMAQVIREAQDEILGDADILAFYLARLEADAMRVSFENYIKHTDNLIPKVEDTHEEETAQ